MTEHFDALEARDPGEREAALMRALPVQVAAAQATAAFAEMLRGVDAAAGASRARCSPRASAPATWCTTASATT